MKLQIWDASGQEKYKEAVTSYYKDADGVIIVYDVTCRESFANIKDWVDETKRNCNNKVTIILVGNKTDAPGRR